MKNVFIFRILNTNMSTKMANQQIKILHFESEIK